MSGRWRAMAGVGLAAGCILGGSGLWAAEEATKQGPMAQTIQAGSTVRMDYTLTVDGAKVDSSDGRDPLTYVQGQGQIIPGLERQLAGLAVGDERDFTVSPEEGYGPVNPEAFIEVPKSQLPTDAPPQVGMALRGTNPDGQPFRATIQEIGADSVKLNLNHPLAGKTLQFKIKIVEVSPPK